LPLAKWNSSPKVYTLSLVLSMDLRPLLQTASVQITPSAQSYFFLFY
jgi:hypothetical protein